jgi:hypothetical protein
MVSDAFQSSGNSPTHSEEIQTEIVVKNESSGGTAEFGN